jgi:hypothetical protein
MRCTLIWCFYRYYSPYPPQSDDSTTTVPAPEQPTPNPKKRKHDSLGAATPVPVPSTSTVDRGKGKGKVREKSIAEMHASEAKKASEGSRGRLWVCDVS